MISLQGWDTASVVTFDTMNKTIAAEIAAQKKNPKLPEPFPSSFSATNKFCGSLQGTWGDWQLEPDVTSAGEKITMACPILQGSATDVTGASYQLNGAVVYISVTLQKVVQAAISINDITASKTQTGNEKQHCLLVNSTPLAPSANVPPQPAVDVISISPPALDMPFSPLFKQWFNANVGLINQIFFTAVLNETADIGDFQWLKPTDLSYATVTANNGAAIFAALCLTDQGSATQGSATSLANQIDAGLANILPANANSVFVISGERFAQHFLRKGAAALFQGSDETNDFDIIGLDMIVTNNKDLLWRNVVLEDKTAVDLRVPAQGFSLNAVANRIELSFTGAYFIHPLAFIGNDKVSIDFTQTVFLAAGKNAAGDVVLVTTNKDPADPNANEAPNLRDCTVTATPDPTAVTAGRVLDIISIAASVLSLGSFAVGKWALNAANLSKSAAAVRTALAAGEAAIAVALDANAALVDASTITQGNLAAAAAFTTGAAPLSAAAITYLTRFAQFTGFIAALTGGMAIYQNYQVSQDGSINTSSFPSLDHFVANALGASQWPHLKTWTLVDARLQYCLLLFGNLSV